MSQIPFALRIVGMHHQLGERLWHARQGGVLDQLVHLDSDGFIPLALRPEPQNRNDPNAIEIIIPGPATLTGSAMKIGYLPRQLATKMHELIAVSVDMKLALDPETLDEPEEGVLWSGFLMTDAPEMAQTFMKKSRGTPPASWGLNADRRARPKTRKRLVHGWF